MHVKWLNELLFNSIWLEVYMYANYLRLKKTKHDKPIILINHRQKKKTKSNDVDTCLYFISKLSKTSKQSEINVFNFFTILSYFLNIFVIYFHYNWMEFLAIVKVLLE